MGNLTPAGVGGLLLGTATILMWKDRAPRFVAWLMLLAGGLLATTVAPYLGSLLGTQILGVGIVVAVDIFGGIVFYHEAIKRHGMHHIRTPAVAAILGISLALSGGATGTIFHNITTKVVTTVHGGSSVTGG
jgi:hypothetical protein